MLKISCVGWPLQAHGAKKLPRYPIMKKRTALMLVAVGAAVFAASVFLFYFIFNKAII